MNITPLTDDEVTNLARQIVTNVVYVPMTAEALDCSFGAFLMLAAGAIPQAELKKVGMICEEYSKAGPLAVNGHPMFLSARFVDSESADKVWDKIQEMAVALGYVPEVPDEHR